MAAIGEYPEGLNWHGFLKTFRTANKVSHPEAMATAGPEWKAYKTLHGIQTKGGVKVANQVIKRGDLPRTKSGGRKQKVAVKAPPKGKKIVVTYVSDSESEDEVEVVKKSRKVLQKGDKPEKAKPVSAASKPKPKPQPKRKAKKKPAAVPESESEDSAPEDAVSGSEDDSYDSEDYE